MLKTASYFLLAITVFATLAGCAPLEQAQSSLCETVLSGTGAELILGTNCRL